MLMPFYTSDIIAETLQSDVNTEYHSGFWHVEFTQPLW